MSSTSEKDEFTNLPTIALISATPLPTTGISSQDEGQLLQLQQQIRELRGEPFDNDEIQQSPPSNEDDSAEAQQSANDSAGAADTMQSAPQQEPSVVENIENVENGRVPESPQEQVQQGSSSPAGAAGLGQPTGDDTSNSNNRSSKQEQRNLQHSAFTSWRRKASIIACALVVIIVTIVVTVVVVLGNDGPAPSSTTTSNNNNNASPPSPTSTSTFDNATTAPQSTPAPSTMSPTVDYCTNQKNVVDDCFSQQQLTTEEQRTDCTSCLDTVLNATTLLASCNTFHSGICLHFVNCAFQCSGPCLLDLQSYYSNCNYPEELVSSVFGGSCRAGSPTSSNMNTTNATTAAAKEPCNAEIDYLVTGTCGKFHSDYQNCIGLLESETGASESCVACVNEAILLHATTSTSSSASFSTNQSSSPSSFACPDDQEFCSNLLSCNSSCLYCLNEAEALINCEVVQHVNGTCPSVNCTGHDIVYPNTRLCHEDTPPALVFGYHICLDLNVPAEDVVYFESARDLWTSVSTGELQNGLTSKLNPSFACSHYPPIIDDLYICGQYVDMDGPDGLLAATVSLYYRNDYTSLPVTGLIEIDRNDVENIKTLGAMQDLVAWAMGQCLGFHTYYWQLFGLVTSFVPGSCNYTGTNANREWQALSNCSSSSSSSTGSSSVPLQQDSFQCYTFWDRTCLGDDLMSSSILSFPQSDVSGDNEKNASLSFKKKLSRITVGALDDFGYVVNYTNAADNNDFAVDSSCICNDNLASRQLLRHSSSSLSSSSSVLLSAEGHRVAREHGLRYLDKMRREFRQHEASKLRRSGGGDNRETLGEEKNANDENDGGDFGFMGDLFVSLLYMENGQIFKVHVAREEE